MHKTKNAFRAHNHETVSNIWRSVETRFSNILPSPVFKHIQSLLDTAAWPTNGDMGCFGNDAIKEMRTRSRVGTLATEFRNLAHATAQTFSS